MISIISPAKSMNFTDPALYDISSTRDKSYQEERVLSTLKKLSVLEIMNIMNVSEKIAELNYDRFQHFESLPEKQAIYAYSGDVYNNINLQEWNKEEHDFAQSNLRIISALYGVLRPLDNIKAYRLEMITKLKNLASKGMNKFWQNDITEILNSELKQHEEKTLINIASNEYSSAVNPKNLDADMINIHFREYRDGKLKNIALNAKRARGMMADYIVMQKISKPEEIKEFSNNGYNFDADLSDANNYYFIRA